MRTLLASAALLLATSLSSSADDFSTPHITVNGTATTEVVPDQMTWYLTARNTGGDLSAVANEHTKIVQAVLDFLKSSKIAENEIQTSRMEFGENWEYRDNSRIRAGYFASTDISFRLTELDGYQALWIGLANIPGLSVNNVNFEHTQRIAIQNETRRNALLKAKEKAADLAHTVNMACGEPLAIKEVLTDTQYGGYLLSNNIMAMPSVDSDVNSKGLAPGTIKIQLRIEATFSLIKP